MTVRRDVRVRMGHAVKANGWRYWLGLSWSSARYYARNHRWCALARSVYWTLLRGYYLETCQICARPYVLWWAPTDIYVRVVGNGGGLFCPNCFDRAAGRAGIDLQWVPKEHSPTSRAPETINASNIRAELTWLCDTYIDLNGWAEQKCGTVPEHWKAERDRATRVHQAATAALVHESWASLPVPSVDAKQAASGERQEHTEGADL